MKKRIYFFASFLVVGVVLLFAWNNKFFPFRQTSYLSLPVQFTSSNIPFIEIEIEGIKCLAKIDLGSATECALRPNLLEKISKQFHQTSKWMDLRGNTYESKEYIVPSITVKSAKIRNLKAKEESSKFDREGSHLWGEPESLNRTDNAEIDGRLGWIFLQGIHPFFDFKNSVFFFTRGFKSLEHLRKEGYAIDQLQCSPFETSRFGCIINVETEYGPKRFMLDTAATAIFIKPSRFPNLEFLSENQIGFSKFTIGHQQFTDIKAYLFEFSDKFENIDGILGMSFFEKNIVFLDFNEHKAWIAPSLDISHKSF